VASLQALLEEGVREGVFPSAAAVVLHEGRVAFSGGAGASDQTVFDLASLTKPVVATAFLSLWAEGKLGPETKLERFQPKTELARAGASVADLLFHRSGLPAWQPFFAPVMRVVPELFAEDCSMPVREQVRHEVALAAWFQKLDRPPGQAVVYSDIGFIVLGEVLQTVAQAPLDALVEARVARPLGLGLRYHRLSGEFPREGQPTGTQRPRPPAPGQELRWESLELKPSRDGEVDDDNAWVMDGVAGHAGLFGSARDVAGFGQAVLDGYLTGGPIAPMPLFRSALARDVTVEASTRAMGFDTPSETGSSAGRAIGKRAPGAVGHLGFSGTSLWVDLSRKLVVALLTNRVALGRERTGIQTFRPRFHDAVVETLGLE
jgi:CubicO group peptidase (beta-lactamase class C family)